MRLGRKWGVWNIEGIAVCRVWVLGSDVDGGSVCTDSLILHYSLVLKVCVWVCVLVTQGKGRRRRTDWLRQVPRMWEMRICKSGVLFENLNGARDLCIEERILLNLIFVIWLIKIWIELNSLWIESDGQISRQQVDNVAWRDLGMISN